jgi:hypothetical protein
MASFVRVLASVFALLLFSSRVGASPNQDPLDAKAVMAADDSWLDAEGRGDGRFLSELLLDGYVSVSSSGKITTKEQIVQNAIKRGRSEEYAKKVAEWRASHPSKASVAIFGDEAILTWNSIDPTTTTPVHSCDVFI